MSEPIADGVLLRLPKAIEEWVLRGGRRQRWVHSICWRIQRAVKDEMEIADRLLGVRRHDARVAFVLRAQRRLQPAREFFGGLARARGRSVKNGRYCSVGNTTGEAAARVECRALALRHQRDIALMIGDVPVPDDEDFGGNVQVRCRLSAQS